MHGRAWPRCWDGMRLAALECGTTIRAAVSLMPSAAENGNPPLPGSRMKLAVVSTVRAMAALAVLVFILCPLRMGTLVLVFVASILVFLICHTVLLSLVPTPTSTIPAVFGRS